jgi:crossover junction endodeoxyribonuclease RusA
LDISFFVPGLPISKGSAKAFVNKHTGRAIVTQDNRELQKPWAYKISLAAKQELKGSKPAEGPVMIELSFYFDRPKSHRNIVNSWHVFKPDADKLLRCVLDALTGVCWKDDSQVCAIQVMKCYDDDKTGQGVQINLKEIK